MRWKYSSDIKKTLIRIFKDYDKNIVFRDGQMHIINIYLRKIIRYWTSFETLAEIDRDCKEWQLISVWEIVTTHEGLNYKLVTMETKIYTYRITFLSLADTYRRRTSFTCLKSTNKQIQFTYYPIVLTCQVCIFYKAHLYIRSNFGSIRPVYEN